MTTQELLNKVKNNGRSLQLIYVGTGLPIIGLSPKCDIGELMSINLEAFSYRLYSLREGEAFVIGRDESCDFVLSEDIRFSRFHCMIALVDNNYYIYDCSLCGTIIK